MEPNTQGTMGGGMPQSGGANMPQGGDAGENKGVAIIARIPILFWIPLLNASKSPFAMFHANQGLVHLLTSIVGSMVLGFVPILGWAILPFFHLGSLAFMIMGMIQASKGEMKELPIVGSYRILN